MRHQNSKLYSLVLIVIDTIVLITTFVLAYIARVQYDPRPLLTNIYAYDYLLSFLLIIPFWILIFAMLGLYHPSTYKRRLVEWVKIGIGAFIGILFVISWQYVSDKELFPARLVAIYALFGSAILLIFEREIMRFIRTLMFKYGRGTRRVLLIGSSEATGNIARQLSDTARSGYEIVAFAGPIKVFPDEVNAHHYSHVEQALNDLEINGITTIIQTDLYADTNKNSKIMSTAQIAHVEYSFIPGEAEFYSGKNSIDVFLGYPMITVYQTPLVGWGAIVKRLFDIVISVLLIIVASPLFVIITLLQLTINHGGHVIYKNERLTRYAKSFQAYKFRSMKHLRGFDSKDVKDIDEFRAMGRDDLVEEYQRNYKVEKDPRITPFGYFLRRSSLDELPQLFNVLRGDLSLVGPRPMRAKEMDAKYSRHRGALLLSVRSGLTGLWQVSGRSNVTEDERIQIELYYVQNWTFWLDIKILIKTIPVVLKRDGAK